MYTERNETLHVISEKNSSRNMAIWLFTVKSCYLAMPRDSIKGTGSTVSFIKYEFPFVLAPLKHPPLVTCPSVLTAILKGQVGNNRKHTMYKLFGNFTNMEVFLRVLIFILFLCLRMLQMPAHVWRKLLRYLSIHFKSFHNEWEAFRGLLQKQAPTKQHVNRERNILKAGWQKS